MKLVDRYACDAIACHQISIGLFGFVCHFIRSSFCDCDFGLRQKPGNFRLGVFPLPKVDSPSATDMAVVPALIARVHGAVRVSRRKDERAVLGE